MIKIRKILLEEYTGRLLKALSEVDVLDKQGNIIISKDLKVRHKDSGYEYTVDDLPPFTGFQIKVDIASTNQAQPSELLDFRAIAVA